MLNLEEGEYILGYLRRHWFLFVIDAAWVIAFAVLPFVMALTVPFTLVPFATASGAPLGTFVGALWILLVLLRGFVVWTNYYLDVWVVTNRRLIDQEQVNMFRRKVSTLELEHIQDITIETDGFLQTMIGFGNLRVQTAGEFENFEIHNIKDPEQSKQIIVDAQNEIRRHRANINAQAMAGYR